MNTKWDAEYARTGIPSSYRDEASGVVRWLIDNWLRLDGISGPPSAGLDVGCGTGRNTLYLASREVRMVAFDSSARAVELARERARQADLDLECFVHDLTDGLPVADGSVDVVLDVFVYKHQLRPDVRAAYRRELARALSPAGRMLVSLAEPMDGYYSTCPPAGDPSAGPHAIIDPEVGVGSVLFSLQELIDEFSDHFVLEMAWRKQKVGSMHGGEYTRHTLASVWRHRGNV
jgi:SAM-dependent methyltransferase